MRNTQVHLITGFLGAGKTTFLNRYLSLLEEQVVVLENEFGEISIDHLLIERKDVPVREMKSGCICCTLAAGLLRELRQVIACHHPDLIVIEPSGVSKTSDILEIIRELRMEQDSLSIGLIVGLVEASGFFDYLDHFGDFYLDQIRSAQLIFMTDTDAVEIAELKRIEEYIRDVNPEAMMIAGDYRMLSNEELMLICDQGALREMRQAASTGSAAFESAVISAPEFPDEKVLTSQMNRLKESDSGKIVRMKGKIRIGSKPYPLQYTPSRFSWTTMENSSVDSLIVIGIDLDRQKLTRWFRSFRSDQWVRQRGNLYPGKGNCV